MSSRTVTIIVPPQEPHVFQYRVESDAFSAEFDADSVDAARERLDRYAAAAPDVQCDRYEWGEVDTSWRWLAAAFHSAAVD